jgi:putative dehydrogenase
MNPPKTARSIGVIGIGAMGMAMARNLKRRGYALAVRDIRPEAEALAKAENMTVCASPRALLDCSSLVAVVVRDAAQIDTILCGPEGMAAPSQCGKTVLLCSTIAPEDTMRFARALAAHGIEVIEAPISGGPARAEDGSMSMMLAASETVLLEWSELLADLAAKRFVVGHTIGDGAKAKLVNNLLAGINLVGAAEALSLAIRLGLDAALMFELISASSGASWVFVDRMARVLKNDFGARAAAPILTKDVGLAVALAQSVQHETPLGHATLARLRMALAQGYGELDDAAVIKTYQR